MSTPYRLINTLTLARKRAGMTQFEVAEKLGVTRQAVASWESLDSDVRVSTLTRWAGVLGFEVRLVEATESTPFLVSGQDSEVVHVDVRSHVAVSGPQRVPVLQALAADYPGGPLMTVGLPFGEAIEAEGLAALAELMVTDIRLGRTSAGVLAVDLTDLGVLDQEALSDVVANAKAAGWVVLLGMDEVDDISKVRYAGVVGVTLVTDASGSVLDASGRRMRVVWRGYQTQA